MTDTQDTTPNTSPENVDNTTQEHSATQDNAPEIKQTVFGDDWREKLATLDDGTIDDKLLKQLSRYSTPKDSAKALLEAQKKISEGIKKPLTKDATPEQVTAWRKENGIPETPDGYDLNIEGIAIGETDKPLVNLFLERMHTQNASPELVKEAVKAYYDVQQQVLDSIAEQDAAQKQKSEDVLREEWGSEYRPNMNRISNLLAGAPDAVKESLLEARTADGVKLGLMPELHKWLDSIGREIAPLATLTPTGNATSHDLDNEMKSLEAKMGTDSFTASDRSRYSELLTIKEKIASR